jgi:hypothetical protein
MDLDPPYLPQPGVEKEVGRDASEEKSRKKVA